MEPTTTTAQQEYPLHAAARNGDHELLSSLLASSSGSRKKTVGNGTLSKGATIEDLPNTRDKDGFTPLHAAAERGHVHCIKVLVKCGAMINAKDLSGRRPIRIFYNIYIFTSFFTYY